MRITKETPAFKPITITLETREELICMRAVADAAHRGRKISQTFMVLRNDDTGGPFTRDAEDFARVLDQRLASDEWV